MFEFLIVFSIDERQRIHNEILRQSTRQKNIVLFDANTLYNKDISWIRAVLWTPTDSEIDPTKEQMSNNAGEDMEWYNSFQFSWYDITVTYYANSHTVIDIFISNWKTLNTKQCDDIIKKFNITDWKLFICRKSKNVKRLIKIYWYKVNTNKVRCSYRNFYESYPLTKNTNDGINDFLVL